MYFANHVDGFRTRIVKFLAKFNAHYFFDAFSHHEMRRVRNSTFTQQHIVINRRLEDYLTEALIKISPK